MIIRTNKKAEKSQLELDEKKILLRSLNAMMDLTDIKAILNMLVDKVTSIEQKIC